jgi:hypothetical protein
MLIRVVLPALPHFSAINPPKFNWRRGMATASSSGDPDL